MGHELAVDYQMQRSWSVRNVRNSDRSVSSCQLHAGRLCKGSVSLPLVLMTRKKEKLGFVSPSRLDSFNPYEALYRNLGVIPSRQLIAFSIPGPLVIPAPLAEATTLADRISQELVTISRGAKTVETTSVSTSPETAQGAGRARGSSRKASTRGRSLRVSLNLWCSIGFPVRS